MLGPSQYIFVPIPGPFGTIVDPERTYSWLIELQNFAWSACGSKLSVHVLALPLSWMRFQSPRNTVVPSYGGGIMTKDSARAEMAHMTVGTSANATSVRREEVFIREMERNEMGLLVHNLERTNGKKVTKKLFFGKSPYSGPLARGCLCPFEALDTVDERRGNLIARGIVASE